MSWQSLKWASHKRATGLSDNAVLRVYADHADAKGRTWVASRTIAKELSCDQETVLDATKRLVRSGLMWDTGERCGETGRLRIFQLNVGKETQLELDIPNARKSRALEELPMLEPLERLMLEQCSDNARKSRALQEVCPSANPEPLRSEDDDNTMDNSIPSETKTLKSSSLNSDFLRHPKYRDFERYCIAQGGSATQKGFATWLAQQAPESPKPLPPTRKPPPPPEPPFRPEEEEALRQKISAQLHEWRTTQQNHDGRTP